LVEAEGKRDAPAAADTAAPPAAPTDAAPTGERPVIVQVRNVVVRYGEATILDGVSFDIREGEIFAILGGSGCGKSTLLRQLIGLERPAAGNVLIDGDDISAAEGKEQEKILRKIGILFQNGALLGSMTVAENISLRLLEYSDLPPAIIDVIVRMKLSMVGLEDIEYDMPSELSGGMKKRAALARALAMDPRILFCDEPSSGLDPISAAELDNLLIQLNRSLGVTIVVVTHDLASIAAIAHRAIMLDKSVKKIIAEGKPADLKEHSDNLLVKNFFNRVAESGENLNIRPGKEKR
jgi:phospholipid/cholesterol/gamma-HCH transport system ATP-binding protein